MKATKVCARGSEADCVIYMLLRSREYVIETDPGKGHVCRVSLVPNRGGLLPSCGVTPFPPAEMMDSISKNSLTGPAVHVQHTAVFHNVLFHVPAPTTASISAHNCVLLPQIFLNHQICGTILRLFVMSVTVKLLMNSL